MELSKEHAQINFNCWVVDILLQTISLDRKNSITNNTSVLVLDDSAMLVNRLIFLPFSSSRGIMSVSLYALNIGRSCNMFNPRSNSLTSS